MYIGITQDTRKDACKVCYLGTCGMTCADILYGKYKKAIEKAVQKNDREFENNRILTEDAFKNAINEGAVMLYFDGYHKTFQMENKKV